MAREDIEYLRPFAVSSDPVLSSKEIAERVDVSQQGAYSRLRALQADGYLNSKKVGARARVFWLSDEGEDYFEELMLDSE